MSAGRREEPFHLNLLGPENRNLRRRLRARRDPERKRSWAEVHELGGRPWTLLHINADVWQKSVLAGKHNAWHHPEDWR